MIRVDRNQQRLWIGAYRVHHFAAGLAIAAIGFALMFHNSQVQARYVDR